MRMIPLHELLSRIHWDPEFGRGEFRIGYLDHVRHELVYVAAGGSASGTGQPFLLRRDGRGGSRAQRALSPRQGSVEGRRPDLAAGALNTKITN